MEIVLGVGWGVQNQTPHPIKNLGIIVFQFPKNYLKFYPIWGRALYPPPKPMENFVILGPLRFKFLHA